MVDSVELSDSFVAFSTSYRDLSSIEGLEGLLVVVVKAAFVDEAFELLTVVVIVVLGLLVEVTVTYEGFILLRLKLLLKRASLKALKAVSLKAHSWSFFR